MTDEEKQQIALAESDALSDLRKIEELIARGKTQRAEALAQLELLRPWKTVHGLTKRQWIVGTIGCTPSFFEQEISLIRKYNDALSGYVKSRLLAVIGHHWDNPKQEQEWIDTWCRPEVSHDHFRSSLNILKGREDTTGCNCQDIVFLTKCRSCGKVKKDPLGKVE